MTPLDKTPSIDVLEQILRWFALESTTQAKKSRLISKELSKLMTKYWWTNQPLRYYQITRFKNREEVLLVPKLTLDLSSHDSIRADKLSRRMVFGDALLTSNGALANFDPVKQPRVPCLGGKDKSDYGRNFSALMDCKVVAYSVVPINFFTRFGNKAPILSSPFVEKIQHLTLIEDGRLGKNDSVWRDMQKLDDTIFPSALPSFPNCKHLRVQRRSGLPVANVGYYPSLQYIYCITPLPLNGKGIPECGAPVGHHGLKHGVPANVRVAIVLISEDEPDIKNGKMLTAKLFK